MILLGEIVSKKVSITLDDDVLDFVDQMAGDRSSFINAVLREKKKEVFLQELANAYCEQDNDATFQQEIAAWDVTVGDGLVP